MSAPPAAVRTIALDWMRGLVMLLMTIDHASIFFNAGRLHADTAATYVVGSTLGWEQFFTRWVTHLCAPTFLFLAGASLALSIRRREQSGASAWSIDRDLAIRGALLIALDLVWISTLAQGRILQVLYAIGASFLAMIALRRLPVAVVVGASLAWVAFGELVTLAIWDPRAGNSSILAALFVARHVSEQGRYFYPMVPWLAILGLGWGFGHLLLRRGLPFVARFAAGMGVASLAVFAVLRGLDGYGNMALHRDDGSLVQWLHVSKYPPSATFVTLELGLSLLLIALFIVASQRVRTRDNGVLTVFGQTALFFYVIHQAVLFGVGKALGFSAGTLTQTYSAAAIAWLVLYPLCRLFRRYKRDHPSSVVRYL